MFGQNSVTSSWGQPQQNQQQQQPAGGSAFGQPSAFGSGGGAFGSGGAFGQNQQQQQQPAANPMFGGLGGTSNTGAFGSTNNAQTNNANPLFGASKPATGFGAFGGGGGTFGGGGAFGASTSTPASGSGGGIFGQANTNAGTSTFGGGGLFGQNKPATGFGATTTNQTDVAVAPVTTGSLNPPYAVFSEKDAANASVTLQYQSISATPQYRGSSFEELRFQDYQQGRKTAGAGAGAFGQPSAFGAPSQPAASTGNSIFGQPAQPAQPTNSIFGGGGAFGQNNQPAAGNAFGGGSAFGQPAAPATGTGLFGGGGAFGQPQNQQPQQSTGFGGFGQPQQPQTQQPAANTGGGLFGGGGAFGAKPAAFGSTTGNTFGGGGGIFGQNQQQQQPAAPSGGLFGQPAAQSQPAFGANNNAPKPGGLFGQPAAQPAGQTNAFGGGGLFGQQNQPNQQQPAPSGGLFGGGGGLFGNNNNNQQNQQQQPNQPQQGGGLFGQPPAQQPSGGLFGGGGGLFGNNNNNNNNTAQPNQQQPAQSFGLFGGGPKAPTPAAPSGGLFGNTFGQSTTNTNSAPGQQPSIFGNTLGQSSNQQSNTNTGAFGGGGLFGNKSTTGTAQPNQGGGLGGGSLFGNSFGGSNSFNTSTNNAGTQGSLTASIAEPIGTNLPIFSMLPPGPRAVPVDSPKKKPGFFVDVPTRSPVPRLQLGYTPANIKLRGFASQAASSSLGGNPFNATLSFNSGKPNALSLSRTADYNGGAEAFLSSRSSSPSLGSGNRQSVKKLILDKKIEPSDLFSQSGGSPSMKNGAGKVSFSPALSVAAREKEAAAAAAPMLALPAPNGTPSPARKPLNRFTAHSTHHVIDADKPGPAPNSGASELQEGDYWVKPDLQTLKNTGYEELSSFKDLVVGRVGYGEIHFLDPVDLTGLNKLSALFGEIVRFDDKECIVYPDSDDVDKPPPGSGLNVRARITLVRCWAADKATREPIKDEKHLAAIKHLKRLRNMKHTHFEGFDFAEGKWTFTVEHF
ncbi:hypothetical protein PLICRDRAFT_208927 [Plicaturopsis crispa FD-325 SS-3]|nr:hypothetical protein PLICRDRAFT_208927 [Plicaturopsis crispa FD-325 SS-3]